MWIDKWKTELDQGNTNKTLMMAIKKLYKF